MALGPSDVMARRLTHSRSLTHSHTLAHPKVHQNLETWKISLCLSFLSLASLYSLYSVRCPPALPFLKTFEHNQFLAEGKSKLNTRIKIPFNSINCSRSGTDRMIVRVFRFKRLTNGLAQARSPRVINLSAHHPVPACHAIQPRRRIILHSIFPVSWGVFLKSFYSRTEAKCVTRRLVPFRGW